MKKITTNEKIRLPVNIPYTDISLSGKVEDIVAELSNLKQNIIDRIEILNKASKKKDYVAYPFLPEEIEIEVYSDGCYCSIYVKAFRMETDEEYNNRIEKQKLYEKYKQEEKNSIKKEKEELEKKEYERLKKKYG